MKAFNARRRTMNLAEVAQAAGINKSSAQRMVHTLEALGYVRKNAITKRFQLTPEVMEIGYNYLASNTLVDVANPFLAELAQVTGETTNLTEPVADDMIYVARFVGPKFIPIHMPLGSRSDERRVGTECRSRWSPYHSQQNTLHCTLLT